MRRSIVGFVVLVVVSGCSSSTGIEVDEPFVMSPGQTVLVEEIGLHVRFDGVSEDSRCPLKAQCVWIGDAAVEVTWFLRDADGIPTTVTLHTHEGPNSVDLGNVVLELVALAPYPEAPEEIRPQDYRATLRTVSR